MASKNKALARSRYVGENAPKHIHLTTLMLGNGLTSAKAQFGSVKEYACDGEFFLSPAPFPFWIVLQVQVLSVTLCQGKEILARKHKALTLAPCLPFFSQVITPSSIPILQLVNLWNKRLEFVKS